MRRSNIPWTLETWNPILGCTRVSEACVGCYAIAESWKKMSPKTDPVVRRPYEGLVKRHGNGQLDWTGVVRLIPERLEEPLRMRMPTLYFTNSMSDIFHEGLPLADIQQIFDVMELGDWHIFQLLTKRDERLVELSPQLPWPENVWMGVSVESSRHLGRIDNLRKCRAKVKWLSLEPLLEGLPELDLRGIDWVVVGGESEQPGLGRKVRKPVRMDLKWVRDIKKQCRRAGLKFFSKQLGTVLARERGADSSHGDELDEWPKDLRVREYPGSIQVVGDRLITQIEGMSPGN
jgi:protein gp37